MSKFDSLTNRFIDVVTPSPACERALKTVTSALERDGHEIVAM